LFDNANTAVRGLFLLAFVVVALLIVNAMLTAKITAVSARVDSLQAQIAAIPSKAAAHTDTTADVANALIKDPSIILGALQAIQSQQAQAQAAAATHPSAAIASLAPVLFDPKTIFYLGNPKAPVSFTEFVDYQCPHCKEASSGMLAWLHDHPGTKIVVFQSPIFGPMSNMAAKAAIAAGDQGKFEAMNEALMKEPNPMTAPEILDAARAAGLNMQKFNLDIINPATQAEVDGQSTLAKQVGMTGTPAFVAPGRGLQEGYGDENGLNAWLKG
jgi:protein-disulfide isomerase